jgi:hypothetical protein
MGFSYKPLSLSEIRSERIDGAIRQELVWADASDDLNGSRYGCVFCPETERACAVAIVLVRTKQVAQVSFAEYHDMNLILDFLALIRVSSPSMVMGTVE